MDLETLFLFLEEDIRPFQRGVYQQFAKRTVKHITADSRKVQKGSVFVCLAGEHSDGHQFVGHAVRAGAVAVVVQEIKSVPQGLLDSYPILKADNTYKALALLATKFYGKPGTKLQMIGVTGTNGKTTVTHLLEKILTLSGKKTGLLGTLGFKSSGQEAYDNTKHTTPMAVELQELLQNLRQEGYESIVMEVSSHALDQYRVYGCDFDVAVLTNVTQDHLDFHKTMANYWKAKAKLFSSLTPKSDAPKTAVINLDDEYAQKFIEICPTNVQVLTYALKNPEAKIRAENVHDTIHSASFHCVTPVGNMEVNLKIAGQFGIYNALAAIAAGVGLQIPLPGIKDALESVTGIRGRFEVVAQNPGVIVDYAHTPDGLKNVLNAARIVTPEGGRLIAVFGCGGDRDASKRPQMGAIAESLADVLVVTSDNPRTEDPQQIITDILAGIERFQPERMIVNPDRKTAIHQAIDLARPGDIVVVAGKGHEDYQILADRTIHFDDREVVQDYIKQKTLGTASHYS
jgi:UDP-N-acetylmuramoyl-L-alanyl-D-glutamate--2,6-diaminopimelate ligase